MGNINIFSENVIINQQRHVYQIKEKGLFAAGIQPTPLVQQQKSITKLMQRVQLYIDDGEAHHSI